MNVTRVDKQTLKCPEGTAPCSQTTNSDNTICYPPEEHTAACPITSIDLVMQKNLPDFEGDYQKIRLNADYFVVFTKTESDSLPVTSTKVEKRPCLDPAWSSDFLYDEFTNEEMRNFV